MPSNNLTPLAPAHRAQIDTVILTLANHPAAKIWSQSSELAGVHTAVIPNGGDNAGTARARLPAQKAGYNNAPIAGFGEEPEDALALAARFPDIIQVILMVAPRLSPLTADRLVARIQYALIFALEWISEFQMPQFTAAHAAPTGDLTRSHTDPGNATQPVMVFAPRTQTHS